MTHAKDRSGLPTTVEDNLFLRLDNALDGWLARHLPLIHRLVNWHVDRMSQVDRRIAWIFGIVIGIIFIISLF